MKLILMLASAMALRYELTKVPRMSMNMTGFQGSLPLYSSDAYNFVYLLNATVGTPPQQA
jgi:hypothetical protein